MKNHSKTIHTYDHRCGTNDHLNLKWEILCSNPFIISVFVLDVYRLGKEIHSFKKSNVVFYCSPKVMFFTRINLLNRPHGHVPWRNGCVQCVQMYIGVVSPFVLHMHLCFEFLIHKWHAIHTHTHTRDRCSFKP